MVTKFLGYYISKGGGLCGKGVCVQHAWLGVGCVRFRVCIDAGVLVVAQRGLWDGLCKGRCMASVLCLCWCLCRGGRWPGSMGGEVCKGAMSVRVYVSFSSAVGMRWCILF